MKKINLRNITKIYRYNPFQQFYAEAKAEQLESRSRKQRAQQ